MLWTDNVLSFLWVDGRWGGGPTPFPPKFDFQNTGQILDRSVITLPGSACILSKIVRLETSIGDITHLAMMADVASQDIQVSIYQMDNTRAWSPVGMDLPSMNSQWLD